MAKAYAEGFFFNPPHSNAPEFVVGKVSINKARFLDWLEKQDANDRGYVRLDITRRRDPDEQGRPQFSVALDDWKPSNSQERTAPPADDFDGDLPF